MADRLDEVLEAVSQRVYLDVPTGPSVVTFISFATLSQEHSPKIRQFLKRVEDLFGIHLEVIGGGFGCTRLKVRIVEFETGEIANPEEFILRFLASRDLETLAAEVPIHRVVTTVPYENKDLLRASIDGFLPEHLKQRITSNAGVNVILQQNVQGGVHVTSGDEFNVKQAGAVGPNAQAVNFSQLWNEFATSEDVAEALAEQLSKLRAEMKREGSSVSSPEADAEMGAIAKAEVAAKKGDGSRVMQALKEAGLWALKTAERLGLALAEEALKKALGS